MPIEFACSSCNLRYSVKDELAGRTAKCGKCGHRMRIPQATAKSASNAASTAKPPTSASKSAKPAVKSQTTSSRPAARPASVKPTAPPAAASSSSWLDDELEMEQPVVAKPTASSANVCPACGKPLDRKAVLCVSCGYDTRTGEKRETQHVIESPAEAKKSTKRSRSVASGGLLRGTLFCFIAALIGALIWAVIVYFTMYEFVYVAIGLGALVGYGMALGNDGEGDSTFAGIIAAFMSLLGIVAAKIMTIMIFVSALLGGALNGLEIDESAMGSEPEQEPAVIAADQERPADGTEPVVPTDEAEDEGFDDNMEFADEPNLVALFFSTVFQPFDAIFILIAFFTAYRVGSGEGSE